MSIETTTPLTLFGETIQVSVTRSGGGIIIRNVDGSEFGFPAGVNMDFGSGYIYYNNELVGGLPDFNFMKLKAEPEPPLTPSSSSGGGSNTPPPTTTTPGPTAATPSPAPNTGEIAQNGTATGRLYATETREDGGARLPTPPVVTPITPTITPPIGTNGPSHNVVTNGGPPRPANTTGPGTGGPGTGNEHGNGNDPTPPTGPTSPAWQMGMGLANAGLSVIQMFFKDSLMKFGKLTPLGVGVSVAGVGLGTYGLLMGMKSLREDFSLMGLANVAASGVGLVTGLHTLATFMQWGAFLGPHAWIAYAAVIAAIAIIGWFMGKDPEDNKVDNKHGDTSAMPNAGAWVKSIASNPNAFMIIGGIALANLGLNLSVTGPVSQSIPIHVSELGALRSALEGSMTGRDAGKKLPSYEDGLLGKVFIQSSENNGITADKIVFVDKDVRTGIYNRNMVSLDNKGYVTGPMAPGSQRVAMFYVDDNGNVKPTSRGNKALAYQTALSKTAVSTAVSPTGAVIATQGAGGVDDYVCTYGMDGECR